MKKHQTIGIANRTLITSNDDNLEIRLDSAAVSMFVVILVELTNIVFVNSTNIPTNIETAALSNHNGFLMMAPRLQDDTEDLGPRCLCEYEARSGLKG